MAQVDLAIFVDACQTANKNAVELLSIKPSNAILKLYSVLLKLFLAIAPALGWLWYLEQTLSWEIAFRRWQSWE